MVRQFAPLWVLLVCLILLSQPAARAASARPHPIMARVRFLATGTSVRNTYYGSNDVYLAEVEIRGRGNANTEEVPVRLVDEYPGYTPPLSYAVLTSPRGARLRLLRDPECDLPYRDMRLRAAPGDLLAILPVKLEYRPNLPEPVQPDQLLPCYRIVRR